ncbi:translation initiation factor IF-2-like [Cervus elaphus]|uniref:translation initiation factor IF-2-like n=1 Tax=Cervus elaphus TaxID=9860 RepID=UPI001CC30022|nr:translation initiation factor IF-2-like [Cervus elaphus]
MGGGPGPLQMLRAGTRAESAFGAEPRTPGLPTSLSHSRCSAELGVRTVPRPDLDPAAKARATGLGDRGICALRVGSPWTQGASTAPTRGPQALREQILGENQAPTRGAPPLPETWNPGPSLSGSPPQRRPHPSGHAHTHTMRMRGDLRSPLRLAESGRPLPAPLPPAPPGPRPEEQLNYERAQEEIVGSEAPADAPRVPVPGARSPPPPSPARGGRGRGGARGPTLLRQNKAHRGSSRPRTEPVTKAGRRRRAPRPGSGGGGGGGKEASKEMPSPPRAAAGRRGVPGGRKGRLIRLLKTALGVQITVSKSLRTVFMETSPSKKTKCLLLSYGSDQSLSK